MVKYKQL
jgi:hypothetical protein